MMDTKINHQPICSKIDSFAQKIFLACIRRHHTYLKRSQRPIFAHDECGNEICHSVTVIIELIVMMSTELGQSALNKQTFILTIALCWLCCYHTN